MSKRGSAHLYSNSAQVKRAAKQTKINRLAAMAAAMSAPSLAATVGTSLRSFGGTELNWLDTTPSMEMSTSSGAFLLNGLLLGTTSNTRLGQRILLQSVQWNLQIRPDSAATPQFVRFVIAFDRQTNATALAWAGAANKNVYTIQDPSAMRNIGNQKAVSIIYDSGQIPVIGLAGTPTDCTIVANSGYKKLNLVTEYNDGAPSGTVGDIQTGSLYLLVVGSNPTGSTSAELAGQIRIRFKA